MTKIKDLILTLAKKVELETNQELLLAISGSGLDAFELPEIAISKLNALMNEPDAIEFGKANIDVKNHHIDKYTSGYNQDLIERVKEAGLSLEKVKEIQLAPNSGDKVKLAIKGMNELISEAKKAGGKGQSEEYVKQVTELQNQIKDLQDNTDKKVNETKAQYVSRMERLALQAKLGFNWNDSVPEIAREATYKAALDKELASRKAKLIFNDDSNDWKVVQVADETLPYVESGKEFAFNDLHSLTLQNNKLLKEAGHGGSDGGTSGTGFQRAPSIGAGTPQVPDFINRAISRNERSEK